MHARVGLEYNRENCKKSGWFRENTWTKKQEQDWIDWAVNHLIDNHGMNEKTASKEIMWFNLNYGWKINHEELD
jgi:hypothetical protein